MGKASRIIGLGLGVALAGAYEARRQLLARWLKLGPVQNRVGVERNIVVTAYDGVRLMTDHYFPRSGGPHPTILTRTPYGRGREGGLVGWLSAFNMGLMAERGYHVVAQTVRGRFDSGGEFDPLVNEEPDGRATLDWLSRQPWFNGQVATWGSSYVGYTQWAIADALYIKALVPTVTGGQFYEVAYRGGPFALDLRLRWTRILEVIDPKERHSWLWPLQQLSPKQMEPIMRRAFQHLPLIEADKVAVGHPVGFYRDWFKYTDRHEPYWQKRDQSAKVAGLTAPAYFIGGWYDIFLPDLLADYATVRSNGHDPYLLIGPWTHTDLDLAATALREGLNWFDAQLKGDRRRLQRQPVRLFITGANQWREMASWPPPTASRSYFLHAHRELSERTLPAESEPDFYRYDPNDPTPSLGGALFMAQKGTADNRPLEARTDVLYYTTAPLGQDLEVIGPVRLELYVKSDREFTDFFGRLCDVQPDGASINVCDGLLRLTPQSGQTHPDGSRRIAIEFWPTAHRFLKGHCLRLQVSSGAHPRYNRNDGTGEPQGTTTALHPANQTVFHDGAHPSALLLSVPK